jgi:glycine/D-amino acid oxidase-like deaminating enzyme
LTETADVVVVGAGIIGASIAYQLARHGAGRVVALDKGEGPAEGSTGASSSICRCRYTHPEVVRTAFHGQEAFGNWAAFTGLDNPRSGLRRIGVLWMFDRDAGAVGKDADRLTREGVKAEVVGPQDVSVRFPALSTCVEPFDLDGEVDHDCRQGEAFLFEAEGGYAEPTGANQDLIEATELAGGEVRFRTKVSAVRRSGGRVIGVALESGETLDAGLVINAAGPWCNRLNELAEVELRWTLTPTRVQTLYRDWPSELGRLPVGADSSTGIYFRPELGTGQVLVGSVLPEDEEEIVSDPDHFKRVPDPPFRELKMAAFHHRVPALVARGEIGGLAGLYTINREDVHPVLGPTGLDGWWVANGFSGHGFKLAPAIGSMIAQAATGRALEYDTDVPMAFFSVDRQPLDLSVKHVLA